MIRRLSQPIETAGWARYYDERFAQASVRAAPAIAAYYEGTARGRHDHSLLDVACGTGQLALWFVERGYSVLGIDLSEHVLHHARERAKNYVDVGRARFVVADATSFSVEESFGLATSLGNLVNLLAEVDDVRRCFERVRSVVTEGGTFVFDAVTRKGMWEGFNSVHVLETEDFLFVLRGIYHGGTEARSWVSGVARNDDGQWERFQEKKVITLFEPEVILDLLLTTGWSTAWPATVSDLAAPVSDGEAYDRILYVAS
jgi:SAM-dependent methyltransferase